ncbi:tetratricopeptide repeat protein [Novosphingobium sp. 9]|uniref:tetratricopeptide repeat protein n=1 Tax=Novosphingobium sp. 9 TaxID=2025349 RepID=UPI0021B59989|nr:hypothetical protein [Novosphingobium sp. 9]
MSVTALLLAASLAAPAVPSGPVDDGVSRVDVAYTALSRGDAQAALRRLQAAGADDSRDPVVLINLAAAYAGTGQGARAMQAYKAAIASRERYDIELADGTWADSRDVARAGLGRLSRTVAAR